MGGGVSPRGNQRHPACAAGAFPVAVAFPLSPASLTSFSLRFMLPCGGSKGKSMRNRAIGQAQPKLRNDASPSKRIQSENKVSSELILRSRGSQEVDMGVDKKTSSQDCIGTMILGRPMVFIVPFRLECPGADYITLPFLRIKPCWFCTCTAHHLILGKNKAFPVRFPFNPNTVISALINKFCDIFVTGGEVNYLWSFSPGQPPTFQTKARSWSVITGCIPTPIGERCRRQKKGLLSP